MKGHIRDRAQRDIKDRAESRGASLFFKGGRQVKGMCFHRMGVYRTGRVLGRVFIEEGVFKVLIPSTACCHSLDRACQADLLPTQTSPSNGDGAWQTSANIAPASLA